MEMEKKKKHSHVRTAVLVVLVMLAIFGYAGGVGLASLTLVPAWLPWTVGAVLALATGLWGRHLIGRMAGLSKVWLCYLMCLWPPACSLPAFCLPTVWVPASVSPSRPR